MPTTETGELAASEPGKFVYIIVDGTGFGEDAVIDVWKDPAMLHSHMVDYCDLDGPEADAFWTELSGAKDGDLFDVDGWEILVKTLRS
jgi:hypothetical protein